MTVPTQLVARIKKSSKYFHQNEVAKDLGEFPFPVSIFPDPLGYVVRGGPGGQYMLSDVKLSAIVNGQEIQLT